MGFNDILAETEKLAKSYVIVGYPASVKTKTQSKGDRTKKGGMSMAEIAAANEYGTKTIPARPFFRTALDENRDQINRVIEGEYNKIIEGKRKVQFSLNAIGVYVTQLIQKKIRMIHFPPNSQRTIKIKKSSKPLIDFGQMISSIQHKVVIQ